MANYYGIFRNTVFILRRFRIKCFLQLVLVGSHLRLQLLGGKENFLYVFLTILGLIWEWRISAMKENKTLQSLSSAKATSTISFFRSKNFLFYELFGVRIASPRRSTPRAFSRTNICTRIRWCRFRFDLIRLQYYNVLQFPVEMVCMLLDSYSKMLPVWR